MDSFVPPDKAALKDAIRDLPENMSVEADRDTGLPEKLTVGDLRRMQSWPAGLAIDVPRPRYPESVVKIRISRG
jgi:hypothetical protein